MYTNYRSFQSSEHLVEKKSWQSVPRRQVVASYDYVQARQFNSEHVSTVHGSGCRLIRMILCCTSGNKAEIINGATVVPPRPTALDLQVRRDIRLPLLIVIDAADRGTDQAVNLPPQRN